MLMLPACLGDVGDCRQSPDDCHGSQHTSSPLCAVRGRSPILDGSSGLKTKGSVLCCSIQSRMQMQNIKSTIQSQTCT